MPRHVRNWWVELNTEHRRVNGGPATSDGGFLLRIMQRSNAESMQAIVIKGEAIGQNLVLRIEDSKGKLIHQLTTPR